LKSETAPVGDANTQTRTDVAQTLETNVITSSVAMTTLRLTYSGYARSITQSNHHVKAEAQSAADSKEKASSHPGTKKGIQDMHKEGKQ
jgi:hypothetical protein